MKEVTTCTWAESGRKVLTVNFRIVRIQKHQHDQRMNGSLAGSRFVSENE
jgi:hypothetical protein